jgi:hypothetical protein
MTSNLRLRLLGGQKYIHMSLLNSYEFYQRLGNTQEVTMDHPKVFPVTWTKSLAFPIIL